MAQHIQAESSFILKQSQLTNQKLLRAAEQLATGSRLLRPGDDTPAFAEVQHLGFAHSADAAKSLAAQTRLSWYQTSTMFLTEIVETLSAMSETVVQARGNISSAQDVEVLDAAFQGYKGQIAQIVDGRGGESTPTATFHDKPLFIGFSPTLEIGAHVSTVLNGAQDVSLYTGFNRDGFDTLPLVATGATAPAAVTLTGTAAGGSTTQMTLDTSASSKNAVYAGMTVTITGGTGSGQTAQIASYDGATRIATFITAVATALDATSLYTLQSGYTNNGLTTVEGFTQVQFAEEVWGADNDRLDRLTPGAGTFRALTDQETTYRTANAIPNSDMEAKTYEEKEARRKLNIFDSEYGNLRTQENADRMFQQVANAIQQITIFLQRHDSRSATLRGQIKEFTGRQQAEEEGADALGRADAFKVAAEYQALSLEPEKLLGLASRLQQNLARLNDLVQNKGVR